MGMIQIVRIFRLLFGLKERRQMIPQPDPWLTRSEIAERLQIPEKTLAQWASQRKGPPYRRFGRHTRYRLSECIAWENSQTAGGGAA